ncbi:carboxymuconolactone decarboxylase [Streptomyces sp. NPDC005921]
MATAPEFDTPVLDTIAAMTIDSVEHCHMDEQTLILSRIAALVAMDAPAISYLAHVNPAIKAQFTVEQLQDLLVAIAPVVGTARVMSAAGHIAQAFGVALDLATSEAEAIARAEADSRTGS